MLNLAISWVSFFDKSRRIALIFIRINFTLVVPNILDPTAIPLASVCACVEAIPTAGATACPQCPMFSTAICSSATCGCACIGGTSLRSRAHSRLTLVE